MVSLAPTALTPTQLYSPEEWEQKRVIITKLYRDEAKPLHNVRVMLAQEHDFRPSIAMLKKRIRKWGLDRNNKHADMLFALGIALERENQGKKKVFLIRSRVVTLQNVQHYFRRKGIHDLQSLIADASIAPPTTRIDCYTPEPDKPDGGRAVLGTKFQIAVRELESHSNFIPSVPGNANFDSPVVALPDPDQVDCKMSLNSTVDMVDHLLYLGRAYYDAVLDNPAWRSKNDTFEAWSLEMFCCCMFKGQRLLDQDNVIEAFVYFGRAFNSVRALLDRQVLLFLPYLYHMLLPDQIIRRQEVFSQLLDFIAQMVMTSYPNLRPIQQSLFLLRRMSIEDRGQSSERVFQSIVDRVLVYFESDMLHNPEPDANQIYLRGREEVLAKQNIDNYKFTPIVLRVLASGADFFHRQRIGHMSLDHLWGHGALKPEIGTKF